MKAKPKELHIGMWVYYDDNKLRKFSNDDVGKLWDDQIIGVAEDHEIPEFEFARVADENLNLDNFFNPLLKVRCPLALDAFCRWVDNYKQENDWNSLFGHKTKFHHIPYPMQFGIFIRFFSDMYSGCSFSLSNQIDWTEWETIDEFIIDSFVAIEVGLRNKEI